MDLEELTNLVNQDNRDRENATLAPYACRSSKGRRLHPEREKVPDEKNLRPVFFHDIDKIIHSSAYTRYIDKTQVFSLFENDHITHRVLHVQLVSKIARVIGRCLGLNEDLIEAIALGHDIGHTPYGHDGESYLNSLCQENKIGSFCHNVQSVRFLMELERGGNGLNLSVQVLDGILCHDGEIVDVKLEPDYGKTAEEFLKEYRDCLADRTISKQLHPMTLEGCVMRAADVIAYIGRDIEDAIEVNLVKRKDIPGKITAVLGDHNASIIDTLAKDIILHSFQKDYITYSERVFRALSDLKDFNYRAIYKNPMLKTELKKKENMFRQLFSLYMEDLEKENRDSSIFKEYLDDFENNDYMEHTPRTRIVVDFISSMTDRFFNNEFKQAVLPKSYGMTIK